MYRAINVLNYDPIFFFKKALVTKTCWIWQGSKYQNGYGKFGRRGIMAHRISYEIMRGPVPTNMCLDHLCRNRACVNPDHLEIVSMSENIRRGESQHAKNARKTHCVNGHEFTPENTYIHPQRGSRLCKSCRYAHSRKYTIKKRQPVNLTK